MRRIVAGNAGLMTGPGTNTYLLGEREIAVLDPGPHDAHHLETILSAAGAPIRWVVVTHTHRDHSPLTEELARRTGAQIIGLPPPKDGRQDESFAPQRQPADGEPLSLGDSELVAIHTPGHASNCVCYFLARERLLFTGDPSGNVIAFDPENGKPLWHASLSSTVTNGPMTYELDGRQYVVVGAGDTLYAFTVSRK